MSTDFMGTLGFVYFNSSVLTCSSKSDTKYSKKQNTIKNNKVNLTSDITYA